MATSLICVAVYFAIGIIPTAFLMFYLTAMSRGKKNWAKVGVFSVMIWVLWPIAAVSFLFGR